MKRFSVWKKIQLLVLILMAVAGIALALCDQKFYENMAEHPSALWIYIMMWVVLIVCFLFMFLDFMFLNRIKTDYHNMNLAAYSDHLSGIPNRFSCDVLIDKYADRTPPADMTCAMFELTNLSEVNLNQGHAQGNEIIKEFSTLLVTAALASCFVGRNSGNKFLAIFENSGDEQFPLYLKRIEAKITENNKAFPGKSIEYRWGVAHNSQENAAQITHLISLADKRIYK